MATLHLPEDLAAWERGEISRSELKRRHPEPEVDHVLEVRRQILDLTQPEITPPAWAAVQKGLRDPGLLGRLRLRIARPVLIGATASILGTGVAAAAGVDPIRDGVAAVWGDVKRIFTGEVESDNGQAPSDPSTTTEPGGSATDDGTSPGSGEPTPSASDDATQEPGSETTEPQRGSAGEQPSDGDGTSPSRPEADDGTPDDDTSDDPDGTDDLDEDDGIDDSDDTDDSGDSKDKDDKDDLDEDDGIDTDETDGSAVDDSDIDDDSRSLEEESDGEMDGVDETDDEIVDVEETEASEGSEV